VPGSKSDYLEKAILDQILGAVAYVPPGTWYIALSTAAYADASTGSSMNEVSNAATGYARFAVTNNATNFPGATQSAGVTTKNNGAAFTFAAASGSWGNIQSFYFVDAPTGGNIGYGGDLQTPKTISAGDTATFPAASISATED
jgi:hypothetical protein